MTKAGFKTRVGWIHILEISIIYSIKFSYANESLSPSTETSPTTSTTQEPIPDNVKCRTPGELVPNFQNCRKYYKCSNGEPSHQSCPGTLIFDSVLKICNWPETTSCISDLLVVRKSDRQQVAGSSQFSKDIAAALRNAATETPVIANVTPANKLSKRILSLFQARERKPNNKIRTNIFRTKNNDNRKSDNNPLKTRISAFKPRAKASAETSESTQTSSVNNFERDIISKNRESSSEKPSDKVTTTQRVTIRPFRFDRNRQNNFKKPTTSISSSRPNVFQRVKVPSTSTEDDRVESVTEADNDEDVVTRVRSEASVSSVSSYVRVSVSDLASLDVSSDVTHERPFSNGRGGDQFTSDTSSIRDHIPEKQDEEDDIVSRLRQELLLPRSSPTTEKPRPKAKPIKCHTGASNELYANPRNCRKYYKCQNGEPSLQSCPANLIFDTNLKICNWPTASSCEEDPEAPLPKHVTSDREPPAALNSINIDDYDDVAPQPVAPVSSSPPSVWEARQREQDLKSQYPLFAKVKQTVRTLDTKVVEGVIPGSSTNPDNVKRVEFILSEENYEDLFPRRHPSYTYRRLLQAIAKFPAICSYIRNEENSDTICRKTLATMFAHFTQETGAHNPSDKEFDEWRQGLNVVREQGCTNTSPGCGYNDNCEDTDSITKKWACGKDPSGKWKKYFGRGAKQLSYNFNYGQFSQAIFDDRRLLLDHPDFVADTWLNMASASWFYVTPQPPKPSMLHVIDGSWVPNDQDKSNGISPGFGATINIINGGVECNTRDGKESRQASNRIEYYKQFAWYLYVDYENEELGCAKQKQFSAGGAGALPIYWDKDWSYPYSCKLVNYQTAHSALVDGEYLDCVEENFNVKIR